VTHSAPRTRGWPFRRLEQDPLPVSGGHGDAQVLEGELGGLTAARGAHEKTFLNEVGFVYVFEGIAIFGWACRCMWFAEDPLSAFWGDAIR